MWDNNNNLGYCNTTESGIVLYWLNNDKLLRYDTVEMRFMIQYYNLLANYLTTLMVIFNKTPYNTLYRPIYI